MAKYSSDKIYSELSKLSPDQMFEELVIITDFVKKALTQQEQEQEDKVQETQQKIQKINGN